MIFYENDQNLAKLKNSKNQDFSKVPFRFRNFQKFEIFDDFVNFKF